MDQNLVQRSEISSSRCFLSFKCLHACLAGLLSAGVDSSLVCFPKGVPCTWGWGRHKRQNWRLFSPILLLQECSILKLHHNTDYQYKGSKSCLCRFQEKEKSGNELVSKRIFSKSFAPQLMPNTIKVSPINSSSKARTWTQTSQRWLLGSSGVTMILSCFSPGLDAGRRVEIEIWVGQPFPLFSAKLISLCPYVTQICLEIRNWTVAISMAHDVLKFLAQCLLLLRASVQWSSFSSHMYCFNFSREPHLPPHSHHHGGLNLSAFMSPWEDLIQWLWGWHCEAHHILSSLLPSTPHLLPLGLTPGGSKLLFWITLKPRYRASILTWVPPKRAHQAIPSNNSCGFPWRNSGEQNFPISLSEWGLSQWGVLVAPTNSPREATSWACRVPGHVWVCSWCSHGPASPWDFTLKQGDLWGYLGS